MNRCLKLCTLLTILPLFVIAGCGGDDGDPTRPPAGNDAEETIGAAGGAIEMTGEVCLTIPPAALDADVDFTMNDAGSSHATMVSTRTLGSAVYSIGPSGTTFGAPVELVLHYDEADLGGVDESSIIIYTDSGSGWTPLPTTVDETANTATAEITHLSDFAVTAPKGEAADGVFAVFEVVRLATYVGEGLDNMHTDMIVARFDSVVNVCSPVRPLHPDSVYCNEYDMVWDADARGYIDDNEGVFDFLVLGGTYTFHVLPSLDVPALEESIDMVELEPVITNLQNMDVVSNEGFTVEWNDTSADSVSLTLVLSSDTVVRKRVLSGGSYTFSGADLSGLVPGPYFLALSYYEKRFLTDVPGYDPHSHILSMTNDGKLIHLGDGSGEVGPDGGTVMLGDDGRLLIPPFALTEGVAFTAEEISPAPAAPEGYTVLSPFYRIGPDGTVFAASATIELDYDAGLLGEALEEDVVILTNSGEGWSALDSWVDEDDDYVEADIDHLSDFVAAVPTVIPTEGVYAVLATHRMFNAAGGTDVMRSDTIFARFDETAGEDPVTPLQAGGVTFGEWPMVWSSDNYEYADLVEMDILTLGASYDYVVALSADVPAMDIDVVIVDDEVYMTNISMMGELPLTGFTVEWNGASLGGTVEILMVAPDATGLNVTLPNTGSHAFTAGELAGIATGQGQILLGWDQEEALVADGFDARSVVRQGFSHQTFVNFTVGTVKE